MRKIDTFKIDLSKLAVSETGVPIGFRELLPEEYPTNGDLFDTHSSPNNSFFDPTRPRWEIQKMLIVGGKSKVPYGTPSKPPAFWFKHYRVLEVPDAVPEGYGVVTGGTLQPGDFRLDLMSPLSWATWAPVHPNYYGQRTAVYLPCKTYRKQPAFPVAPKTAPVFAFVFDRDYKSGCDKLQAKVNELTKRLRDSETALGVRTEQLEDAQTQLGSTRNLLASESARACKFKDRGKEFAQRADSLEESLRVKEAILKRTSDECCELADKLKVYERTNRLLSNSLTGSWKRSQDVEAELRSEVSDLKARIAELTPKDPGVGEGYRELLRDEIPQPTDEWSYLCASTNVRSSWTPRSLVCKETYGELLSNAVVKGFKYRRKLPVPGPAAAPADAGIGEGYRELRDAELPQPGDEFSFDLRDATGDQVRVWNYRGWASTSPDETYGRLKRELGAGLRYRRKVRAQ